MLTFRATQHQINVPELTGRRLSFPWNSRPAVVVGLLVKQAAQPLLADSSPKLMNFFSALTVGKRS